MTILLLRKSFTIYIYIYRWLLPTEESLLRGPGCKYNFILTSKINLTFPWYLNLPTYLYLPTPTDTPQQTHITLSKGNPVFS